MVARTREYWLSDMPVVLVYVVSFASPLAALLSWLSRSATSAEVVGGAAIAAVVMTGCLMAALVIFLRHHGLLAAWSRTHKARRAFLQNPIMLKAR